jgi:hypothetical protein
MQGQAQKTQGPPQVKVIGFIKDVQPWRRGEPTQFLISTMNSGDFTCAAPITMFCNVQPGDSIDAFVQIVGDRQLLLVRQPFIMMPVDENNVKACFIRALRGSGFGAVSATELYTALLSIAKRLQYNKPKPLMAVPPTILPDGMLMAVGNPRPKREDHHVPVPITAGNQAGVIMTPDGAIPVPGAPTPPIVTEIPKVTPGQGLLEIKGIPKRTIAQDTGVMDDPEYKPTELSTGSDGVVAVLSEMAGAFTTSGSKTPVTTIMSATKLREQQVIDLLRWWHNNRSLRRLYLLGLTKAEIRNARMNLDQLYEQCMTNPYRVCAIPIDKCNNLMLAMGQVPKSDDVRAGEIIRKVHTNQEGCGHTCTPYHLLRKHFMDLPDYKLYLEKNFDVKYEYDAVYTRYAYKVESSMALYFNELIKRTAQKLKEMPKVDSPLLETALYECKTLNDEQKIAIQGALIHNICIIRGGAGVGKTTCIREIVRNLELRDISYAPCSFTGKAVSRIADVLKKRCAMTMDRMISQPNSRDQFQVCIVDEFSMVTLELVYRFVRAHPWDFRFIFIGDPGQLQPIGWGAVMLALIDCQRVPVYTLTVNHRIIKHELDNTDAPQLGVEKAPGDIEFDRVILDNANELIDPDRKLSEPVEFREGLGFYIYFGGMAYVTTIVKSLYDSGICHKRVKIMCPYTEPLKQLNSIAQQIFLPGAKKVMDNKQRLWAVGDSVMMTHNNYTINVMNGEEGEVTDVDTTGVKVIFADGAEHKFNYRSSDPFQEKLTANGEANTDGITDYDGDELLTKHLVHSFAISVHKSQGSEYEFVIGFIPPHPSGKFTSFINRNLVYTLWTRAKRCVWTVTDKAVLDHAAATNPSYRYEYLCRRLYQSRDKQLETEMEALTIPKVIVKEALGGGGTFVDEGNFDHEDESMYEQHYQD